MKPIPQLLLTAFFSFLVRDLCSQASILYHIDEDSDLTFESVEGVGFSIFGDQVLEFDKPQILWLRSTLPIPSQIGDTLFLEIDTYQNHDFHCQVEVFDEGSGKVARTGSWFPLDSLDFPDNHFAVRFPVIDRTYLNVVIKMKVLHRSALRAISFRVLNHEQAFEARRLYRAKDYHSFIFLTVFWTVLLLCLLVAIYQYMIYSESAYLGYGLYLLLTGLYYFRNIESVYGNLLSHHGIYGGYVLHVETAIQYLSYTAYIFFIYHFLNIRYTTSARLARIFRTSLHLFVALIGLDLIVRLCGGHDIARGIYDMVRSILFPLIFVVIFRIWKAYPTVLARYILLGTLLLVIPIMLTVVHHLGMGRWAVTVSKALWKSVTIGNEVTLYSYSTKVGLMLEMVCFLLGLLYRNKMALTDLAPKRNQSKGTMQTLKDPLIVQLRDLVLEEIDNGNLKGEQICQKLGVSRSSLHNKLKRSTGKSLSKYIREIRLEQSRDLLLTSQLNISEIAYQVGFNDPNYFSRVFSQEYGLSPKRMREEGG